MISRRNTLTTCSPSELAIYKAMEEVEALGANVKLTDALVKLDEARNLVADIIDEKMYEAAANGIADIDLYNYVFDEMRL